MPVLPRGCAAFRLDSVFVLESLERRTFLSTSIPLSTSTWTAMGPGALGTAPVSGRASGIAAHPTDPNIIYLATAGGGVWKTANAGASWIPLTDSQPTLFMGAMAIAPSDSNVIYAGTGEATNSGLSFYGRGMLKSSDAGATWSLVGNLPDRRTISAVVVDPLDPDTVYAAVASGGVNGIGGNTGIWKSENGGATWINTTASISTTAYYSDLAIDPSDGHTLYAAVGNLTGSGINGVYKTIDAGASWAAAGDLPSGVTIGNTKLAVSRSSPGTVYASVIGTGQPGSSTYGSFFRIFKTTNAGANWAATTAQPVNYTGTQGWYDTTIAVDPVNPDIVYLGGSSGSNAIQKTSNGGASWSAIGTGGTSPHADHHAMAFDAAGRLLDGNDGGIYRLNNSNVGSISWQSLNSNINSIQFVGVALNPTSANIAYGGSQDNGTEKFNDNLNWTIVRGGDGGFARVDQTNPNIVYHEFQNGAVERSDNAGSTWVSIQPNTTDPWPFYTEYVMDPANSSRLIVGSNRLFETSNRGTSWTPISATNTAGWNTTAAVSAIAMAQDDADTIYASAGGRIFVTSDHGATWQDRSIPGTSSITELTVDPSDKRTIYAVRDSFGAGHAFRSTNGGASWTNISGNLPDLPTYTIELDTRGAGSSDDLLYVGNDNGVYVSSNSGASWSVMASGLPKVQVRELEYQKNLGILAAGTHGRGLWEISVPDLTAPAVTNSAYTFATAPHKLSFGFTESVAASLSLADFTIQNLTSSTTIPAAQLAISYDVRTNMATLTFPGFTNGVLPDGRYRATLAAAGITDGAGNALSANYTFDFFFLTGDANHDAAVDLLDFNILSENIGQTGRDFTQGNFDYNSTVDLIDFNLLAKNYGTTVGPELFSATRIASTARNPSRIIDSLYDDLLD
jgi:hypothetical protein